MSVKTGCHDMRVLTALAGAEVGGAEAFFVSLSSAFARAGLTVHAALRPNVIREGALTSAGISFDRVTFGGRFDIWSKLKLQCITRKFAPEIVLAFAGRASMLMPKGGYAFIGRLGGYYKLKNFQRCDYLVCNTPDLVRYCIEGGWPKERVFHIPNFPNLEEGVAVERATLATPNHVPLALAMGRLHPNKAHDVLIRAAALIPDLWVWIAGEGPERANLGGLVRELGLESRVKFLGWRTDRAGLFKAVDLCVYPSRKEPFGNVVVEAWGYGVPLVTAASTGPAWLARDGEDALLTPVDDANALAEAIKKVIGSRALAQTLAENGRRRVAAAFSESVIVRQYLDLFETVRPQTSRFRTRREGRLCGL